MRSFDDILDRMHFTWDVEHTNLIITEEVIIWCVTQFGPDTVQYRQQADHSWEWEIVNPNGAWTYLGTCFHFRRQEDAALFKLFWG